MNKKLIYGIQQIGIGVTNADDAFKWYASKLGADALIFDDSNTATFMAKYMGDKPREKRALLGLNLKGGGGYEIWQYKNRTPKKPENEFQLGDLGIQFPVIKTQNIRQAFDKLSSEKLLSEIVTEPDNSKVFYLKDPFNNILKIKEEHSFYSKKGNIAGISGAVLGVSDIDKSLDLYSKVLGYDKIIYDRTDIFEDLSTIKNGTKKFRRVLLTHSKIRKGGFASLFGNSHLELIQALENKPNKIFENRFWGDLGHIHLCFDVKNITKLAEECKAINLPFQVMSSKSFDMGDANGHWGYIEDIDGTLIEFIETNNVPLIKKLGLSIDLTKRNPEKPLPNWMIKALRFKKVKFK